MDGAGIAVAISVVITLVGWAVTFGTMKARIERQERDYTAIDGRIERISEKLERTNGPRIERLEREIDRLRGWRHNVENTRLGDRLMKSFKDEEG